MPVAGHLSLAEVFNAELYGQPGPVLQQVMDRMAQNGSAVRRASENAGGYLRPLQG